MASGDRAQSEVVGVALLIGVVVTVVGIIGVLVLSGSGASGSEKPLADVEIDATATAINLTHTGGDDVPADEIEVVVRGERGTRRFGLDDTNLTGPDDRFGLGDRFERAHGLTGETATVLVVHTPTNTVLAEQQVALRSSSGQRPEPSLSYAPSDPTPGELVTFDAGGSSDPDGRILNYAWDFDGDGTIDASGETVSHRYGSGGSYEASVTVTDNDGNKATRTETVTVVTVAPTAAFTYSPSDPTTADTVTFDAGGSSDPDGTIQSYAWDFDGDGATDDTGETVTYSYVDNGSYNVTLTVTDDSGTTGATNQTVQVDNVAPTAAYTATIEDYDGDGDTEIVYDASASSDPDGSVQSYEWDLDGDGAYDFETEDPVYVRDTFLLDYGRVRLQVTDDDGATATETKDNQPQPTPGFELFAVVLAVLLGAALRRRGHL